jgi:hypothetical protein
MKQLKIILRPRSKAKIKVDYTLKDIYKFYVKEVGIDLALPYPLFRKINEEKALLLKKKMLLESDTFKLPCNLGEMRISKRKLNISKKILKVDWAITKKIGKRVYHLNEHRNGYRYRIQWSKAKSKILNKSAYHFKPCRTFNRELAYILKNKPEIDYFL